VVVTVQAESTARRTDGASRRIGPGDYQNPPPGRPGRPSVPGNRRVDSGAGTCFSPAPCVTPFSPSPWPRQSSSASPRRPTQPPPARSPCRTW
jgi:hypothetical protein